MSSAAKKIERKQLVEQKKNMGSQLNMFDRIPDKCDTCHTAFDKKSKEMAMTWFVVVKSAEKIVRLFCPDCMKKAKEAAENVSKKYETPIVQEDTGV
jgi:DNA-binding transcriptional regulator GbsR (MarR family)